MRRKDREVTDNLVIDQIISDCSCCRLGFNDEGRVYIVPLNFGFKSENGKRTFYFHSAKEGRKIDLINKNDYAAFELDMGHELIEGKISCDYSARFKSVIGEGKINIIIDNDEKIKALNYVMEHNTHKSDWTYNENMLNAVCVFKLEVTDISCKIHD